jgi:hypothetical protein
LLFFRSLVNSFIRFAIAAGVGAATGVIGMALRGDAAGLPPGPNWWSVGLAIGVTFLIWQLVPAWDVAAAAAPIPYVLERTTANGDVQIISTVTTGVVEEVAFATQVPALAVAVFMISCTIPTARISLKSTSGVRGDAEVVTYRHVA